MSNKIMRIQDDNIYTLPTTFGDIRCTMINNDIYMVGKDVAECLGYTLARKALLDHIPDDEKLTFQIRTSGQYRSVIFINESGLYRLALRSHMSKAQEFADWVVKDVLPSIRKHGHYVATSNAALEQASSVLDIANPKVLIHNYIDELCKRSGCTHTSAWILFREVMSRFYDFNIKLEKEYQMNYNGKAVSSLYALDKAGLLDDQTVKLTRDLVNVDDYKKLFESVNVPMNIADASADAEAPLEKHSVTNHKMTYQLNTIQLNKPNAYNECFGTLTSSDIGKLYNVTNSGLPFSIAEGF